MSKQEENKGPAAHHCDGYYFSCDFRSRTRDIGDIRYDANGWLKELRFACQHEGKDKDGAMCRHCPENRGALTSHTREVRKNRRLANKGIIVTNTTEVKVKGETKKAPTARKFNEEEAKLWKILGLNM
jgi:hypothetical protein